MRKTPCSWSADLALMDIPTRFEADDPRLLDAALAPYSLWRVPARDHAAPALRVRLRLGRNGREAGAPEIAVAGSVLRLRVRGARGGAAASRGEARCTVAPGLVDDPERLAAEVVDTLVLFLLSRRGRVPVHASGVLVGGTAVVLAGPSGSGKSTLALAAAREGLPILSDDAVRVQLDPAFRVWGFPRPIHIIRGEVGPADPDRGALRLRRGRWKVAVRPEGGGWTRPPSADRSVLCLLERGSEVAMHRIETPEAVGRMVASLEPGFDHFRPQMPAVVAALASAGAWRLTLSDDPSAAIAALREVVARGGGSD